MTDRDPADGRTDASPAGRPANSVDERAVHERLRDEHADVFDAVAAAAEAVAADEEIATADTGDAPLTDGRALAAALERELADAGVLDRLPAVLETAVDAAGLELAADPVAAPPYVAVTSRGPVLRGSTPDGRLVVVLRAFRVERDPLRYVRTEGVADAVSVSFET
ncbi:hypothetical protein [Halosimplex salinum]|uniref:hypothetical protein n=1 Tax=Halosimplex salinum TaxID=1710538 RepID=UPI001F3282B7|nr:hypothetical protein [Halosimplex salinum]